MFLFLSDTWQLWYWTINAINAVFDFYSEVTLFSSALTLTQCINPSKTEFFFEAKIIELVLIIKLYKMLTGQILLIL